MVLGLPKPASYVVVDINPSVKLDLNKDAVVIGYDQLNEDAKTLNLKNIKGETVEQAVETIASEAFLAGFMDVEDLEDDYILITTVSKENSQDIQQRLEALKETSELMGSVNVALAQADEKQLKEAIKAKVPVGLLSNS